MREQNSVRNLETEDKNVREKQASAALTYTRTKYCHKRLQVFKCSFLYLTRVQKPEPHRPLVYGHRLILRV
jgi:hypothetical protein